MFVVHISSFVEFEPGLFSYDVRTFLANFSLTFCKKVIFITNTCLHAINVFANKKWKFGAFLLNGQFCLHIKRSSVLAEINQAIKNQNLIPN